MVFESGAITVGAISVLTIIITKIKCFVRKNGHLNYGCGFLDGELINNDDDTEIKTVDLGTVHVLYVKKNMTWQMKVNMKLMMNNNF